jgi:hypothetical protein
MFAIPHFSPRASSPAFSLQPSCFSFRIFSRAYPAHLFGQANLNHVSPFASFRRPRGLSRFQLHMTPELAGTLQQTVRIRQRSTKERPKLSCPGPRIGFRKKHALFPLDNPVEGWPCRR